MTRPPFPGPSGQPVVGVSLKLYMGVARTAAWLADVAALARSRPAHTELFVLPSYICLPDARDLLAGTPVGYGSQHVHWAGEGPWTGEVSAAQLAELGCTYAEIGHAERRRHFGETDATVQARTTAALEHGLVPVICVGDDAEHDADLAIAQTLRQVRAAVAGAAPGSDILVAYEPVWAIGADRPAPAARVRTVTRAVAEYLTGSGVRGRILYGGSAGPGTYRDLLDAGAPVDGLFLGRRAHDPAALAAVLDEVEAAALSPVGHPTPSPSPTAKDQS
ncbi:triose-phosphate isomerase family protein [Streptomyces sp. NPDC002176]|uniref:triose-phosphate isomerase family protein n=1 Tax=Streptomyces sp. NPDC002176 TaxID=3364634 RepID=UPI00384B6ACB